MPAKASALVLVADFTGERLCPPFQFTLNRSGIAELVARVESATDDRPVGLVRVGVEATGYHLPLVASGASPRTWEAVEFNPAHVAEQRRTNGKRGVKSDVVDATAMFDLLAAGSRDTGGCCESGDHRAGCVGAVPPWAGRVAP
jgi:transposase